MKLAEPMVAVTDVALAVEAAAFSYEFAVIAAQPARAPQERAMARRLSALFGSVSIGAVAGALVHGPIPDPASRAHQTSWQVALISVAGSGLASWTLAAHLLASGPAARGLVAIGLRRFTRHVARVQGGETAYRTAIAAYLPGAALLGIAFAVRLPSGRHRGAAAHGLFALVLTAVGALAQQRRMGLHPRHLDHNVVYHVLQGIALVELRRAGQLLTVAEARDA